MLNTHFSTKTCITCFAPRRLGMEMANAYVTSMISVRSQARLEILNSLGDLCAIYITDYTRSSSRPLR